MADSRLSLLVVVVVVVVGSSLFYVCIHSVSIRRAWNVIWVDVHCLWGFSSWGSEVSLALWVVVSLGRGRGRG